MAFIAPTIPTIGDPNSSEDGDIVSALNTIVSAINGNLDSSNITAGSIENADLASPNAGVWRNVLRVDPPSGFASGTATAAYGMSNVSAPFQSGGSGTPTAYVHSASSLAVNGMTTQFRVAGQVAVNATAPGVSFVFDVRGITAVAGGAGAITTTFSGTPVTDSTATVTTPAASSIVIAYSSPFVLVDAAQYLMTVSTASPTVNSLVMVAATLQVRHI